MPYIDLWDPGIQEYKILYLIFEAQVQQGSTGQPPLLPLGSQP